MTNTDSKGLFVTFEGIDGSGKSTQATALLRKVQEEGFNAVLFREPGGTRISEQIRQILLSTKHSEMDPLTEVMLYSAARAQLTVEMIVPGLMENDIVICDRYFDSTIAYQGYGRGIDLEFVNALVKEAAKKLWPDVTFLVDVNADLADKRSGTIGRPDRLEMETKEFKIRVIEGFKEIAKGEPERFIILDGNEKVEAIADEAWQHISMLLSSKSQSQIKHGQNA